MRNPSKNKICILTSVHPVFDTRVFHKEARTLVEAGYDVTLIAQHNKNEIVEGIKIIPLPKPKNRTERFLKLDYLTYKKALREKADIYHFHDPELLPWALLLKKITKAKIIYDVHEEYKSKILSKSYIFLAIRKICAVFFNFFEKWISKYLNIIITADNYVKSKFKHCNVYRIANFPSFLNTEKIQKVNDKVICIYSGGLSEDRGIIKIIEALQYLKNIPIEIILLGKWENEHIKNYVLRNSEIKYLGYKPWNEAMKMLLMADIGLNLLQPVPAYLYCAENSIKIFEYMMVGLPIISSNFVGLKKIIEGNHCGICVDPLKPEEIAKGIEYLIEHPEEAKKMGENGKKAVLEKYNWENESKKLIALYQKLLENNINEKNMDNK